jgi:hypothetical protein
MTYEWQGVAPSSLPSAGAPQLLAQTIHRGASNVVILVTLNTAILIGTTPVRAVLLAASNAAEMNGLEDILYPDATNVESLVGRNVTRRIPVPVRAVKSEGRPSRVLLWPK